MKRWQPAIREYFTHIYQGVWVFLGRGAKKRCMDSFPISLAFILSVIQAEHPGMWKSPASSSRGFWGDFFCFIIQCSAFCIRKKILEFLWFDLLSINQKSENKRVFPKICIFTFLESSYGTINKGWLWACTLSIQLKLHTTPVTPSLSAQGENSTSAITENHIRAPKLFFRHYMPRCVLTYKNKQVI